MQNERKVHQTKPVTQVRTLLPEDVARFPLPGMAVPSNFSFSPDGKYIAFLHSPEGSLDQELYIFDTETGEERHLQVSKNGGVVETDLSLDRRHNIFLGREVECYLAADVRRHLHQR